MASAKKFDLQSVLGLSTCVVRLRAKEAAESFALTAVLVTLACLMVLCVSGPVLAQSAAGQTASEDSGVTSGGYLMHTSVEAGYRSSDVSGSGGMYDTLVDQRSGPRLLDETLSMQSLDQHGFLFDDLNLNSFGWGGEPDNALRLRADKDQWYALRGSFRRDHKFFDYNLLANPLNPPTSTPSIQALNSPHLFDTMRRMSDVDLTLAPQSLMSLRLGYSHNNMTGPVFSSTHEGADALLLQPWNTTMNSYRLGVDWKFVPRTVISYDQFLDYYRGDTDTQLASFAPAVLPNGTPVELGVSIDTANRVPCAVKPPATSLISAGTLTNLNCSGYFSYLRNQRVRTSNPTERLSVRSNYFERVELVGSFSYSDAEMNTPLYEDFDGLITRTGTRAFVGTGAAAASRISNVLDTEGTVHLTSHLRLVEKFYFWAYRIPQDGNFSEVDSVCIDPKACNLLTPLSATAPATTPTLTLSSFNQTRKRTQTELAWDISKKFGARIGYRYGDQHFDRFMSYASGNEWIMTVHEQTALLGIWARPSHGLRLNFDLEHTNYDNVIVPMAPRKESRYRFQTSYSPRQWAVLGGSINILDDANPETLANYVGHNRNYGLSAALTPRARFGLDLAYNYNDAIQNALICFADTVPTGVTLPFVTNATLCPGPAPLPPSNPFQANSFYTNHTQFGMATARVKFAKRATVNAGGSITNVDGNVPQFNALQPLGSAQYRYYQPVASLSVDLGHKLAWNTGWNYYQYNEGSFVGPTAPRYFHANSLTESLRYAF